VQIYRANQALIPLLWGYWRLDLNGAYSEIPSEGPVLLVANHSSYLDPWFIGLVFPRPVRYLIDHGWYWRSPLATWFFRGWGTIPVKEKDPIATTEAVCSSLAQGDVVGIFPEGGISSNGRLRRFRSGVVYMAARSGAPVIPLGIQGAFRSLPRQRRVPLPTKVTIRVGRARRFEGSPWTSPPPEELRSRFLSEIRRDVLRLAGVEDGTHAANDADPRGDPS
jgi:1-acyl-sn-glycerol-3-phosphate acyltransferase